jgi:hypothetical protein
MPTLLERSAELSAKLERIANRQGDQERYNQLTPILDDLTGIAEELSNNARSRGLFAANSVPVATVDVNLASAKLGKLKTKLENSPDKVAQGNEWANAKTALTALTRSIDDAMTASWKGFVDGNTPGIDLLQPYAGLGEFRQVFQRLQSWRNEAAVSKQTLPTEREDFTQVTQRKLEMESAIANFGLIGEPEDCQNLLMRCASVEGFPLGELTDDQLKWLNEKGFAKSLRVKSI